MVPKSVKIASELIKNTGLTVATEIMDPIVQMPLYEGIIPKNKLLIWNPAVNQLGYQMYNMGFYANKNNWMIGIKNGKWLGDICEDDLNIMEKNWIGQVSFATKSGEYKIKDKIIMIHRGVDTEGKGKFRNLPVHESAKKVKDRTSVKMFFDPSHSFGKLLRDDIVKGTIEAMKMETSNGDYLYDGILVEVGTSKTDTHQHITIEELKTLCEKISEFRELAAPEENL